MARNIPRNINRRDMRRYIKSKRNFKETPHSIGSEDINEYYQRCSLVLIGAAAGWIEGHSGILSVKSFSSTFTNQRYLNHGLSEKEAACLQYILSEFSHIDADVFFSEHAEFAARLADHIDPKEQSLRATVDALNRNYLRYSSNPRTAMLPKELNAVLDEVSYQLGLSQIERDVFALAMVLSLLRCSFSYFAADLNGMTPRLGAAVISKLTGHPESAILDVISPGGSLARVGILDAEECLEGEHLKDYLRLDGKFRRWVVSESAKKSPSYELLARVAESELELSDYEHLSEELGLFKDILTGALSERQVGINILLVGPPGSGKTEAAKVIADAIGTKLYQVEFLDLEGGHLSLDAADRLQSYNLGQRLLSQKGGGVLLFDEIEDVLEENSLFSSKGLSRSKAYTNNLLETNAVPTIWVTNRLGRMDPAWLRRFSYVLEVPVPPRQARERILQRMLSRLKYKLNISEDLKKRIVDVEGLSAGQIRVALKALDFDHLACEDINLDSRLEILLREPLRLAHGINGLPKPGRYQNYSLEYVNAKDTGISDVVAGIGRNPQAKILLSGPPGTGKTGFAHFVAQKLGKPLLRKTAANILGSYVGESERAIARMFAEATRNDCVLLLDEADGLMRNRDFAQRQWEVTLVNELLSRMEDFPGIFLCSTNHVNSFDPAAIRRFLFKIEFDYLREEQALALLCSHLSCDLSPEQRSAARDEIRNLRILTPADFSNVRERLVFLGKEPDAKEFLKQLRDEVAAKLEKTTVEVGFGAIQ